MTYTPRPGDFGLTKIGGFVGWWVGLGQFITGDASRYTHAFIVLDNNQVIEAMPGGAVIAPLDKYLGLNADGSPKAIYANLEDLTDEQREIIVREARKAEGIPYSFLDYLSLALLHFGIKPKRLRKYIADSGHMICSQLVDHYHCVAGYHMFKDGRLPQDVTPGDLANFLIEKMFVGQASLEI
jgi:hypothetical protein